MRKKRSKRGSFTVGEKIFGVILAIIVLFPFYWIAISSFKTTDTITQPDLWPVKSTLTHYKQLLSTPAFMSGLRSSIIVAVGTIVVLLIIVILASYGLYRFEFKGKAFFNKLILLACVSRDLIGSSGVQPHGEDSADRQLLGVDHYECYFCGAFLCLADEWVFCGGSKDAG